MRSSGRAALIAAAVLLLLGFGGQLAEALTGPTHVQSIGTGWFHLSGAKTLSA